jgi:hypothetical protein
MTCADFAALPGWAEAATEDCVHARLDVGLRALARSPSTGLSRGFEVSRSRGSFGVTTGDVGGRVGISGVRTGGEQGYVGVAGETVVARLELAEARWGVPEAGLALSGGIIEDPWIATSGWELPSVAQTLAEDTGWWPRTDVGARAAWTSPGAWASVAAGATSGEGLDRRERNEAVHVDALVVVRPLAFVAPERLEMSAFVRRGRRAAELVADHRIGLRMQGTHDLASGGAELLFTDGVEGDGARSPSGLSGWAVAHPRGPALALARYDRTVEVSGDGDTATSVLRVGLGARHEGATLVAAYDAGRAGTHAVPVAGAEGLRRWHTWTIQVGILADAQLKEYP